jgi:hypothetical protein
MINEGGLRGLTPPATQIVDDKDANQLLKLNSTENRVYTDWETWIMTLGEVASRSPLPTSVYINQLIIEKLLIFVGNIKDSEEDFRNFYTEFTSLPPLSKLVVQRDGSAYTIQDIDDTTSKIQIPMTMFQQIIELSERKQNNKVLNLQIALKIKLFKYIRKRTGYFNERGKFSLPEWLKAVTLSSSPFLSPNNGMYDNYNIPQQQQYNNENPLNADKL